jgi:hypothetical protein
MARKQPAKKTQEQVHAEAAMDELVALSQELGLYSEDAPDTPPTTSQDATEEPSMTFAELDNTLATPEAVIASEASVEPSTAFVDATEVSLGLGGSTVTSPDGLQVVDGKVVFVVEHPDLHWFTDLILKASRCYAEVVPHTVPSLFGVPRIASLLIPQEHFYEFFKKYIDCILSPTGMASPASYTRLIAISTYDPLIYVNHLLRFGKAGAVMAKDMVAQEFINGFAYTAYLVVPEEAVKNVQDPFIQVY